MINCFGTARAEYNLVGPESGLQNLLFLGLVQIEAKENMTLWGQGAETLALQDSFCSQQAALPIALM